MQRIAMKMEGSIIRRNETEVLKCVTFPPKIHSHGIWGTDKTLLGYSLPVLELEMVMIFALTQLLHFPLQHLGISRLLSEIMAGVILGSTFLGHYSAFQAAVFPLVAQGIMGTFLAFGFIMFMFISGVKMDVSMLKRTGAKAWVIGILNGIVPLVIVGFVAQMLVLPKANNTKDILLVITTYTTTAFPVIAQLLKDVKISNSELGRLALSSSLIANLFGTTCASIMGFISVAQDRGITSAVENFVLCISFVCFATFVCRPLMFWVAKQTPEGRPVDSLYIYLIIIGAFASAVFSHYFELSLTFGSFVFGLAVPEGPPIGSALVDKLDSYSTGILLPLFVSFNTLRAELSTAAFTNPLALINFVLIVVTFFSKFLVCLIPALFCRMPFSDALALSLVMSAKGVVDLAKYTIFRDQKKISQYTFSVTVIATALNAAFVPLLVRWLYDPSRKYAGYQKRNIMHTKQSVMLPIFVCIHRPDNVIAVIRLLDASSPSVEKPIAVFVLHLIELRGRTTPIFISHKFQTKTVGNISYSENAIFAFREYERNQRGSVTVQNFTAISPRRLMHEDICSLALDTLVSIIVIPFHRQWSIDGSIEADDLGLRTLNLSVIERAPCSVAILVDRGHLPSDQWAETTMNVAIIFLGGSDDQEALVYAKRMTKNPNITLTVVHLVSADGERKFANDKERIVESEMLNEMKGLSILTSNTRYVNYLERKVQGGHDTSLIITGMVNAYDLIIVGRRHNIESPQTSGLQAWSEFPELGVVGDLLASSDLKGKASVLVVQQQHMNC